MSNFHDAHLFVPAQRVAHCGVQGNLRQRRDRDKIRGIKVMHKNGALGDEASGGRHRGVGGEFEDFKKLGRSDQPGRPHDSVYARDETAECMFGMTFGRRH